MNMLSDRPYSAACDNNKGPILTILKKVFTIPGLVLEIGSGTGQHAAYFSEQLPHLIWQPTDRAENLPGIRAWRSHTGHKNLKPPLELDVAHTPWPISGADYIFSANTVHIMSWDMVEAFFSEVGKILALNGIFCLYGPFNYKGNYTSTSNAQFDVWLKQRDPQSGIRDFDALNQLADNAGMRLYEDFAMPANNRTLVWKKFT